MPELSASLQVNIMTLIVYDDNHSVMLRNLIDSDLLEGAHFQIGLRVYRYIDKYGRPPKDHVYDLFADILEGKDKSRAELFGDALDELDENSERVQPDFVVNKAEQFVQEQALRRAVLNAADILDEQGDEEDKIERVKSVMADATKTQIDLFDPGTKLTDYERSLKFLDQIDVEFKTGIKELDSRGITPARKELFNFLGVYGAGKTTWLANLARHSIIHGKRVCHISLEMPEDRVCQRYFANLLGITKREQEVRLPQFEVDDEGRLVDIWHKKIKPKLHFTDDDIREKIIHNTDKIERHVNNLVIKDFPTSTLTINNLKAYLDMMEQTGFEPDLLIIDYIDLMKLPSDRDSFRIALGQLTKEIRGIAGERNLATVTVSQINREGAKSKKKSGTHVQEDWSKMGTVDTNIVYDQTGAEEELGLARIKVDKARYDEKLSVLIAQNYAMNQFCRDSHILTKDYWSILGAESEDEDI